MIAERISRTNVLKERIEKAFRRIEGFVLPYEEGHFNKFFAEDVPALLLYVAGSDSEISTEEEAVFDRFGGFRFNKGKPKKEAKGATASCSSADRTLPKFLLNAIEEEENMRGFLDTGANLTLARDGYEYLELVGRLCAEAGGDREKKLCALEAYLSATADLIEALC